MGLIELDSLSKKYGAITAVRDLSISIDDGEFLVLVGPSGCGKSTALRMIAGLESITSGELRIDGRRMNDVPAKERQVAMVFQNYALYPHMTVAQNIGYPLRIAGVKKEERLDAVMQVAETLQLGELLDRKPSQLSGGQRQRVAIGRAMIRDPSVFLMDEPLSNLDAKLRVYMRTEISALQRRLATTTVYVTHDQTEAMTMGDRVAVLKAGELQQIAQPEELYLRPANLFVAGFIGAPAMNLWEVDLVQENGPHARIADVHVPLPASVVNYIARHGPTRLVVGVRPDDAQHVTGSGEVPEGFFTLKVEAVLTEMIGSEHVCYSSLGMRRVTTGDPDIDELNRSPELSPDFVFKSGAPLSVRVGEQSSVAISEDRLHFFDLNGGLRIDA